MVKKLDSLNYRRRVLIILYEPSNYNMIGYIYCTITSDGCYYIGQHKRAKFNPKYFGSGVMLKGKTIEQCYMIDSAESIDELNEKETYWILKCIGKHKMNCINISTQATGFCQKVIVNRHDTSIFYTDTLYFAEKLNTTQRMVSKWIHRTGYGSKGLYKFKGKHLKPIHKTLLNDWMYMPLKTYIANYS